MSNPGKNHQSNFDAALFRLSLERSGGALLHIQLGEALRALILSSAGASGLRLPSGRNLAAELSVSRMTVTTAYDQLVSEGYLVTRRGSGTFVADHLPHLTAPPARTPARPDPPRAWLPFQPGVPDPALFPHRIWARHLERAWRAPAPGLLGQPDPFGWQPLRAAICAHLSAWRGLECHPDQVLVTSGASEAIEVICQALLRPGQRAAIEDPGWQPLRGMLARAGIGQIPCRVDVQGLDAETLPHDAAAVFVTPSRHFPTGAVMPLARRMTLLDWAARHRALIVEDDYDSEFRYVGQPLPSMAGLDGLTSTVYLGSFSKLLSPALRLGCLVVPASLVGRLRDHVGQVLPKASLVPQPALAELMHSGDFATHLRRMRRTYARRQAHLLGALDGVARYVDIRPDPSGMHLCCPLRPALALAMSDTELSSRAAERGIEVRALSSHSVLPDPPQGLLLGYAAFAEDVLDRAARTLNSVLEDCISTI